MVNLKKVAESDLNYKFVDAGSEGKIYFRDKSNSNILHRVTTILEFDEIPKKLKNDLIGVFTEAHSSKVVKRGVGHLILENVVSRVGEIEVVIENKSLSSFEKAFLISFLCEIEDSNLGEEKIDLLCNLLNREDELPRNYFLWDESEAIFMFLPVIKETREGLFDRNIFKFLEYSYEIFLNLSNYLSLLRIIIFLSDNDYDEKVFKESEIEVGDSLPYEISDLEIHKAINWFVLTRNNSINGVTKKALKIISSQKSEPRDLNEPEALVIDNKIKSGRTPAFFDRKDGVYYQAEYRSARMFQDVILSMFYTTEEMELIEKYPSDALIQLFVRIGEHEFPDGARFFYPEFVKTSEFFELKDFLKVCEHYWENAESPSPWELIQDLRTKRRRAAYLKKVKEKPLNKL